MRTIRNASEREPESPSASHANVPPPVDTIEARDRLEAEIRAAKLVAFDTEFHPEGSYAPKLMLMQFATPQGAWCVDPLAIDVVPLIDAICEPSVSVVAHAAQADLQILYERFERLPAKLFDTQLAAAFVGWRLQESLAGLCSALLGIEVCKGERFTDWSLRPLSCRQIAYALGDVEPLLALHERLHKELAVRGRLAWFEEDAARLCRAALHGRDPETLAARIRGAERLDRRGFAVLIELVATREALARALDRPRNRVVSNQALLELAHARPRHARALKRLEKLSDAVRRRHGEALLAAIERAFARSAERLPTPPPPRRIDDPRYDAMRRVVREEAERLEVAPELLAPASALRRAFVTPIDRREALLEATGLEGWRSEVLGERLWRAYSRR